MSRVSTRGLGPIVKTATNLLSEMPGGEKLVLQAVRDMLEELRDLRRRNARLQKQVEALEQRLERERMKRGIAPRPAVRKRSTASRPKKAAASGRSAKTSASRKRAATPAKRKAAPRRQKGFIESAVDAAERLL